MNLSVFATGDDVFQKCECIKGYTFKMVAPRGKSTHIAYDLELFMDKSAHLTAAIVQLQDSSVYSTVLNASRRIYSS